MTEEEFSLSICIPFCDKDAHFIPELLNSIYEKVNFKDYEILLIDNRDNKVENFDFSNPKIRYVDMNGNKFPFSARMECIVLSTKKYIWFIDADDKIDKVCFEDIKNTPSNEYIIRFLYKYFDRACEKEVINNKYRVTNIFIPNSRELKTIFIIKFRKLRYEKIYFGDDMLILHELEKKIKFFDIDKIIYYVNTTDSAGSFSKQNRSIKDYLNLCTGIKYEFSRVKKAVNSEEDIAKWIYDMFLKEIKNHNEEEQKEILDIIAKNLEVSTSDFNNYLKIAKKFM